MSINARLLEVKATILQLSEVTKEISDNYSLATGILNPVAAKRHKDLLDKLSEILRTVADTI